MAAPATSPPRRAAPAPSPGTSPSGRRAGWAAIAAVAAGPLVALFGILVSPRGPTLYGDQALIAIGARRAAGFSQLLGPYSRAGFHHPGPALFYLLAPFVAGTRSAATGLYVGAAVINLAALVATVAVIRRRAGDRAALAGAVAIDLLVIALGPGTFREPWNPYLVIAPMLLFVVLWAAAGEDGSHGIWAVVVGSYEAQTHLATVPVVAVLLVALAVRSWRRPRRRWSASARLGAAVATLMWTPPVIELVVDQPNNLQELWRGFVGAQGASGWGSVGRVASTALTVIPFGSHDYANGLHRSAGELVVGIALLAGLIVLARRQATGPFARRLVWAAVVVGGLGSLSLIGSGGPVFLYFALWLSVTPVLLLMAIGTSLPLRCRLAVPAGLVVAGLLALTVALPPINRTIGSGPWPAPDAASAAGRHHTVAETAVLDRSALSLLPSGARSVRLRVGSPSVWPYAAGIALALEEHGVTVAVGPKVWTGYFGPNPRLTGPTVSLSVTGPPTSPTVRR